MRKIVLSKEEMRTLQELGLDTSDASLIVIPKDTYQKLEYNQGIILGEGGIVYYTGGGIKTCFNEKGYYAYTLSDLLENHLYKISGYLFGLDECSAWIEDLDGNIEEEVYHHGEPTINSVFKILCYCLKKGLICTR